MGLDILLFLLLGLFVGTFGTLVGIGGGLICVPIFIFFLSDGDLSVLSHGSSDHGHIARHRLCQCTLGDICLHPSKTRLLRRSSPLCSCDTARCVSRLIHRR